MNARRVPDLGCGFDDKGDFGELACCTALIDDVDGLVWVFGFSDMLSGKACSTVQCIFFVFYAMIFFITGCQTFEDIDAVFDGRLALPQCEPKG